MGSDKNKHDIFCVELTRQEFVLLSQKWAAQPLILCMMFYVSVIASNATMVVYGILFGGMHPLDIQPK